MIIRKLRLERGWSQEQLAEMSGLSVRTIQRIERGQKPGLESLKCLAAVFETEVANLMQEESMTDNKRFEMSYEERKAITYVRDLKIFYGSLIAYIIVIPFLVWLNLSQTPEYHWFWWPIIGWGFGLVVQAVSVFEIFNIFSPEWEQRQIEKRLNRKG